MPCSVLISHPYLFSWQDRPSVSALLLPLQPQQESPGIPAAPDLKRLICTRVETPNVLGKSSSGVGTEPCSVSTAAEQHICCSAQSFCLHCVPFCINCCLCYTATHHQTK